jgi:uncharacterized cupin superfamily protein
MHPTRGFRRIDASEATLEAVAHDPSDTPVAGARHPRARTAFVDATGCFTAGVWACDAGTLEIRDLAIDEACYLIEGEVILTDADGRSERFVAGEAFVLPRGFSGTWHMPVPIRKYNAMHTPDGGLGPAG